LIGIIIAQGLGEETEPNSEEASYTWCVTRGILFPVNLIILSFFGIPSHHGTNSLGSKKLSLR